MNNQWQKFLEENNATLSNDVVSHFDDKQQEVATALNGNIVSDFSRYCYLHVTGEDAVNFLQGQLSNDISHVTDKQSQISSYSTPKGRMLAIFRIFKFNDAYILLTTKDLKENLLKRLRMFVLMAKVTITDVSDEFVAFLAAGKASNTLENVPTELNSTVFTEYFCITKIQQGLLYFAKADSAITLWSNLIAKGFTPVGDNAGHLLSIKNGIPAVYPDSVEAFIPQHTNLDTLEAINFKKGCYTGQEVIARLHYLGKQKRKMYLCSVSSDTAPKIKDAIYKENEKSKQGSGNIVDVASTGDNRYLFLAVLPISNINEPLFIHAIGGDKITIEKQPYLLATE